jgi:iron(III) transport system substrate-binding protein
MLKIITIWLSLCLSATAFANDQLVILSPHRKSMQEEFIPRFKDFYKKTFGTAVDVEWLDNGGTADAVRLLRTRFAKNPQSANVDIIWGGGTSAYLDLSRDQLLAKTPVPAGLNATIAGVPMYDKTQTWYATAMSSFGIFTNRKVLSLEGLTPPKHWEDLAGPKFRGQITLADPRHSGTALTMAMILLQAHGWDKGWSVLTRIAANTRAFTQSSSDPIKAVVAGDAAASMAIDFYAQPKVDELGTDKLDFLLPDSETVLDPDPVAVAKGAPHAVVAARFVNYLLSLDAQKILILPKGAADGPRLATLGRMAVTTAAYDATEGRRVNAFNPFKQKKFVALDLNKTVKLEHILGDLLGATQIDLQRELAAAWMAVIKRGLKPEEVADLTKAPVSEKELLALSTKWDDNVVRNQTINAWANAAKATYKRIAGQ